MDPLRGAVGDLGGRFAGDVPPRGLHQGTSPLRCRGQPKCSSSRHIFRIFTDILTSSLPARVKFSRRVFGRKCVVQVLSLPFCTRERGPHSRVSCGPLCPHGIAHGWSDFPE